MFLKETKINNFVEPSLDAGNTRIIKQVFEVWKL
jgi:hypothetical protein